jgi:hypothetical protein
MSLYSLAAGEKPDCAESAMHVLISVIRALLLSGIEGLSVKSELPT